MKLLLAIATAALTTCYAVALDLTHPGLYTTTNATRQLIQEPGHYIMCGADLVGHDVDARGMDIPSRCLQSCISGSNLVDVLCDSATWTNQNGGTCWQKQVGYKGSLSTPNAGADSAFELAIFPLSATRWSFIGDNSDMTGYDIGSKGGANMSVCMGFCDANPKCFAVTWTNYQGGTCWLKRRASAYVAKAGAKSAYLARHSDSQAGCPSS